MCKHAQTTVVTGGKLAIHQCDICGAIVPEKEVDPDVMPLPIDIEAMKRWEQRAAEQVWQDTERMELLKLTDYAAWKQEVRRLLNRPIAMEQERERVRLYVANLEEGDRDIPL